MCPTSTIKWSAAVLWMHLVNLLKKGVSLQGHFLPLKCCQLSVSRRGVYSFLLVFVWCHLGLWRKITREVWVIDQVWGQDCWILAKFFFFVFMDRDEVEVHKLAKKERGKHPTILTEQTWSIKDLLYGFRGNFSCGIQRVVPSGKMAPSCPSQSQRAIWLILPARGASHILRTIINHSRYIKRWCWGKSERSDWCLLSRDLAIRTVSTEMVLSCAFFCFRKPPNSKHTWPESIETFSIDYCVWCGEPQTAVRG